MKVIYPISKWNNANRARARHIANDEDGRPLCYKPGAFKNVFSWEEEDGDPTCTRCIQIESKSQEKRMKMVVCDICSAKYLDRVLLMETHESFVCPTCDDEYSYEFPQD